MVDGSVVQNTSTGTSIIPQETTSQEKEPNKSQPATDKWKEGLEWTAVLWIGFLHLSAFAAPFCFTWGGLLLAFALSWVTGCLGVCLGFHRLLTHASFETSRPLRWTLAVLGTLAGEGPPIMWVAAHRKHHRFSDQPNDPHSPRDGKWWSHLNWMLPYHGSTYWALSYHQYARDLVKDRFIRLLDQTFLWWHLLLAALVFCAGWLIWDVRTGISFAVWGMSVRMVYVLHMTWAVNSASHIWGYRTYETRDNSRNLWWLGLLGWGEGWHNNHHAFQRVARHGHRWWEWDMTYLVIALMERTGLAWNVVQKPANFDASISTVQFDGDEVLM